MSNSNGLITAPVSIRADLRNVIASYNSLIDFNTALYPTPSGGMSTRLNKWSRIKPYGNDRFGLYVYQQTDCVGIKNFTDSVDNWKFVPPDGSTTYPYKLKVYFDGYYHNAGDLYTSLQWSNRYYIEDTASQWCFVSIQFNSDTTYAVNILDFKNIVYPQAANLYFGVLVLTGSDTWSIKINPNAIGVNVTTSTTESGLWNRGLYLTSAELPTLGGYTSYIYPIVIANTQYDNLSNKKRSNFGLYAITLPGIARSVVSASMASYISGSMIGITVTQHTGSYHISFTYVASNSHTSRAYTFQSGTATLYICSTVQDVSGYQGYQVLCQFSATISSFTVSSNSSTNRSIQQLWSGYSGITDPLIISCADTSISSLKIYLDMPNSIGNAGFYDVTTTAYITRIAITSYPTILYRNETYTCVVTAYWSNGNETHPSVSWSSSDSSYVSIDSGLGIATGVGNGYATITASYITFSATCTIRGAVAITAVSLGTGDISIYTNDVTDAITATISPSDATFKDVIWSYNNNSNPAGISLYNAASGGSLVSTGTATSTRTVYARSGSSTGTTTLKVTTTDPNKPNFSATRNIIVNSVPIPVVPVTDVTILDSQNQSCSQGSITLGSSVSSYTFGKQVAPSDATRVSYVWTSSNTGVANVDGGTVTKVSSGTSKITVTANGESGSTASDWCNITFQAPSIPVTGISIDPTSLSLSPGGSSIVVATLVPFNATNQNINLSISGGGAVATVGGTTSTTTTSGSTNTVNAVANGTATITATSADGGYTATCAVTVTTAGITAAKILQNGIDVTSTTVNVNSDEDITDFSAAYTSTGSITPYYTWSRAGQITLDSSTIHSQYVEFHTPDVSETTSATLKLAISDGTTTKNAQVTLHIRPQHS